MRIRIITSGPTLSAASRAFVYRHINTVFHRYRDQLQQVDIMLKVTGCSTQGWDILALAKARLTDRREITAKVVCKELQSAVTNVSERMKIAIRQALGKHISPPVDTACMAVLE